MTTEPAPAALGILRRLDTRYIAALDPDAPCWLAYPCINALGTHTEWWLARSDNDATETHEFAGLGDAGEERALRLAIAHNRSLCPAEECAQEVDG